MLGERRSNSLFTPAAPAEPERKPEQAEVHDISFEERTGRSLFVENATAPRASELFFAPQEKGVTFAEALSQVQGYLSETYATAMLPKGCNEYDFGKPLYEFQVLSDIHLNDNPATAAVHNEHRRGWHDSL